MTKRKLGLILGFLAFNAMAFAATFEDNLKQILSETGFEVKIISSRPLVGMNGMRLVDIEFRNATGAQRTPFLATSDGKGAVVFSTLFFSAEKSKNNAIIEETLKAIDVFNQTARDAKLDEMFRSMPQDRFVEIPALNKSATKTTIIVSSPDCPYCREELMKINEKRKNSHVKMVIVPLNGDDSYVRAQIAINEVQKLTDPDDKIKALHRIYDKDYQIPHKQKNIDTSFVTQTAEMIFKTGLIRGVPYIHEMD